MIEVANDSPMLQREKTSIAYDCTCTLRSSMSIFSFPEFVGRCFLDTPTQNKLGLTFLALPFKALKPKT